MSNANELSQMLLNTVVPLAYDVYNEMMAVVITRANETSSGANNTSSILNQELAMEDLQLLILYSALKMIWVCGIFFFGLGALFTLLYYLYDLFFVPYERVKRLGSIG